MVGVFACVFVCLKSWGSKGASLIGFSRAGDNGSPCSFRLAGQHFLTSRVGFTDFSFPTQPRDIESRSIAYGWVSNHSTTHFSRMTVTSAVIHPSLHAAIPTKQNTSTLVPELFIVEWSIHSSN